MLSDAYAPTMGFMYIALAIVMAAISWSPRKLPARASRSTIDGGFWFDRVEFSLLMRIRSADERILAAAVPDPLLRFTLMRVLAPIVIALVGLVFVTEPAWRIGAFIAFNVGCSIMLAMNALAGYRSDLRRMASLEPRPLTDVLPTWVIVVVCVASLSMVLIGTVPAFVVSGAILIVLLTAIRAAQAPSFLPGIDPNVEFWVDRRQRRLQVAKVIVVAFYLSPPLAAFSSQSTLPAGVAFAIQIAIATLIAPVVWLMLVQCGRPTDTELERMRTSRTLTGGAEIAK